MKKKLFDSAEWIDALMGARLAFVCAYGVNRLQSNHWCGWHEHPHVELVLHRGGPGIIRFEDGREEQVSSGCWTMTPPNFKHDVFARHHHDDLCLMVDVGVRRPLPHRGVFRPALAPYLAEEMAELVHAPARNRLALARRNFRAANLILAMFDGGEAEETATVRGRHWEPIDDYIRRNLARRLTAETIGAALELNGDYLRHLFKRETGQTLADYVLELRIAKAEEMMGTTTLPLKTIAAECGFAGESYFSSAYRRLRGQPPSAYRAESRPPPRTTWACENFFS